LNYRHEQDPDQADQKVWGGRNGVVVTRNDEALGGSGSIFSGPAIGVYGMTTEVSGTFIVLGPNHLVVVTGRVASVLVDGLVDPGPLVCRGRYCVFSVNEGGRTGFRSVDMGTDPPTVGPFVRTSVGARGYDLFPHADGFTVATIGGFPGDEIELLRFEADLSLREARMFDGTVVDSACTAAVDPTFVGGNLALACFNEGAIRMIAGTEIMF